MSGDSDSDGGIYSEKWLRQQLNWTKGKKEDTGKQQNDMKNSPTNLVDTSINSLIILSSSDEDMELEEEIRICFVKESNSVHRFSVLPTEHFFSVFDKISKLKNVSYELIEIVMMPENRDVSKYDSLKSLRYTACSIFNVYIKNNPEFLSLNKGSGSVEIKCIAPNKTTLIYKMDSSQPLDVLIFYCARDLKRSRNDLKLMFDGEIVKPSDTCTSLGLESQDLIEIHFI